MRILATIPDQSVVDRIRAVAPVEDFNPSESPALLRQASMSAAQAIKAPGDAAKAAQDITSYNTDLLRAAAQRGPDALNEAYYRLPKDQRDLLPAPTNFNPKQPQNYWISSTRPERLRRNGSRETSATSSWAWSTDGWPSSASGSTTN